MSGDGGSDQTPVEDSAEPHDDPARGAGARRSRRHPGATRSPPLAMLFAVTATGVMANTVIGAAVPDILTELGQPSSRAGLLIAAGTLPGIVMAPVIGLLADRFGRRRVLVPCLVLFGAAGGLAGLAPSFELLIAARLFQGVGAAGLINLAMVLISDHWSGTERARLLGFNTAVLTVALAVLPGLGGALTDLFGWRWAFAPYLVALLTAVGAWRWLDDSMPGGASGSGQLRGAARAARAPGVVAPTFAAFVVFVLIFGLFLTVMPIHLRDNFGLSASARGIVLAVPAISSTVAALLLGRLRGLFEPRTLVVAAMALFAVSYSVVGAASQLAVLIAAAIVYGFGEGMAIPTLQDLVAGAAPPDRRGAVMSVMVGAIRAGQTTGPLLAGAALAISTTGGVFIAGGVLAGLLTLAVLTSPGFTPLETPPALSDHGNETARPDAAR